MMHLWFFVLALISICATAFSSESYRFIIVTDHEAVAIAGKVVKLLQETEPFKSISQQIEIKIIEGDASVMNCHGDTAGINRVVSCDIASVAKLAAPFGPNKILAVTSKASGGSGGSIPVLGAGYPISTLLHELMHSYGFDDEYQFTEADAAVYCRSKRQTINVVCFNPKPAYQSDSQAKTIHRADITWFALVHDNTLITHGDQLGTEAKYEEDEAALYRGGGCNIVTPCWKPFWGSTIMSDVWLNNVVIPKYYQKEIIKVMESELGHKFHIKNPVKPLPGDNYLPGNDVSPAT